MGEGERYNQAIWVIYKADIINRGSFWCLSLAEEGEKISETGSEFLMGEELEGGGAGH